jgi:hypothetical protein
MRSRSPSIFARMASKVAPADSPPQKAAAPAASKELIHRVKEVKQKNKQAEKPPIQFQVFASMRFNANGPVAEARLLKEALAERGVQMHIIGQSITVKVFETLEKCDAMIAFGSKD